MSDTMLLGVLRMPFGLAMATPTAQIQYHQRGVQAADEIEKLTRERDEARAEVDRLRAEKDKLRDEKEALHVAVARIERASAGAIYSQESIYAMASSALEALEAKP